MWIIDKSFFCCSSFCRFLILGLTPKGFSIQCYQNFKSICHFENISINVVQINRTVYNLRVLGLQETNPSIIVTFIIVSVSYWNIPWRSSHFSARRRSFKSMTAFLFSLARSATTDSSAMLKIENSFFWKDLEK